MRWNVLSASFLLIVAVVVGLWGWRSFNQEDSNKLSLPTEQASASSKEKDEKEINPLPHSAVVIGLREDDAQGGTSSYRTVFVAPEDNKLKMMGTGSGVWMPYKTNFWQIDAVADELGKGNQTLTALRSGVKKEVKGRSEEESSLLRRTEKLLYAGNTYVSILQTTNVDERGQPGELSRVWINELPTLDPAVRAEDSNALANGNFSLARALGSNESGMDADQWAIARENNQWVAKQPVSASTSATISVREIESWPTINVQLPEPIVKDDPLAISWKEVQRLEPAAVDAYTSQNEDIALIVTDTSLKLIPYRLPEAEQSPVSIDISPTESVVMVQWATQEKYIDNWIQMFGKWFRTPAE